MNETIKFGLEDIKNYVNDDDAELSIMKVNFLSTRENTHKINITEEILRRDAHTILGKWLIAQLNMFKTDVKGHEVEQNIFGYFPTDQEIQFIEKDGYIVASANAVVSKLYAKDFYELFTEDNFRNASVEMLTINQRENEFGGLDIDGFNITGCTVLGKKINGSCPDANVEIIQFSEENAKEFYSNHKKELNNKTDKEERISMSEEQTKIETEQFAVDIENLWSIVYDRLSIVYPDESYGSIYRIEGIYEEAGQKFAIVKKRDDVICYKLNFTIAENGVVFDENLTEVELTFIEKNTDNVKFAEPEDYEKYSTFNKLEESKEEEIKEEKLEESKDEEVEKDVEDEEKMAEESKEEVEKMSEESIVDEEKVKLAEDLKVANDRIVEMEAELNELREFKLEALEKEKNIFVENFLASIKGRVSADDYSKFKAESEECKFENLTNWSNGILANIAKDMLQFGKNKESHLRMSVENKVEEKKSLWNRL